MILVRDLWKSYRGESVQLDIIKGLNFEIPKGQFVAIVGKSGSGKTTLLSLLAGLDQPTRGEIFIEGQRIDHLDEEALAPFRQRKMGFIFQAYHLVPTLTALENVTIPAELAGISDSEERAKQLLAQVGLSTRLHHLPSQLSGGEQQRVSICRSLINNPEILFADEPTGNLDSHHGEKVLELLFAMKGSRTLVLVTHDRSLSQKADRVIELIDGQMNDVHSLTA